ncbi:MAG: hypothetical protein KAH01_00385 [Caldisericia bacterium]|nr:hypothetical protein [Caldisericia bacterium]
MAKIISVWLLLLFVFSAYGCNDIQTSTNQQKNQTVKQFTLSSDAQGLQELVDNISNITIVSKDDQVLKAEYNAGFIQGKLQAENIISTRDNTWDLMYLLDSSHSFPKNIPPTNEELDRISKDLLDNYNYTLTYIENLSDSLNKERISRLLFRMLGIYHGLNMEVPANLDFSGTWLPKSDSFNPEELQLGYETPKMTWLDIYFINASADIGDLIAFSKNDENTSILTKCSAFVKKTEDEVFITHNSWYGFLGQSLTMNLAINQDIVSFNAIYPGIISSSTDFGYNNKGIMFNETTHNATYSEPKKLSLWSFWRAALAEQFSTDIKEFFEYIAMDLSGTYMNGYMVVDAKTKEIGLIEISYKSVVCFYPSEDGYLITTIPQGLSTEYDHELVNENYILGINYPASEQIRQDLKAVENRPARRTQFLEKIDLVTDINTAKNLITYTDPKNPLSIYGRWDLGYGETPTPKTVPDGAIDAKAASSKDALALMELKGIFDPDSKIKSFWMKYGTASIDGSPFVWSQSIWSSQKLRNVPDRVDGSFHWMNLNMR